MPRRLRADDLILNYDPEFPQKRFRTAGLPADSTDYYKLQGLGRACDMGDAMVGNAMQDCPGVAWYSVRNASDPQIANPSGDIETAEQTATQIYTEWGAFTTAASAIATWAIIDATFN